ncbi:putative inactive ATP-dependent zinc metalloprotease FTSHI 5, chloroplastic [Vitis vinifera]|uniref:Putative inactive ATP-dependent zinc metalloprotease FTSHI 5, chloroplastic n=1 Tax=Vitis vinifera TaxID=29760 RepID=A0A438DS43_VITVI|nr:putative inactive ATP-dependent zinc metalloprotease FTSHI 5, chloroplastic [Vitis vinifera]
MAQTQNEEWLDGVKARLEVEALCRESAPRALTCRSPPCAPDGMVGVGKGLCRKKSSEKSPTGVLIVGERGTGKTSLALAIAAEAKVPVVEVKAQQLEAGLWVGQSASNVRELFQAARDLVVLYNLVNFRSFSIMKKFN